MTLFTVAQLAKSAGVKPQAVRRHIKHAWLKPEPKAAGVKGHRISEVSAKKWLGRHYPGKQLSTNNTL